MFCNFWLYKEALQEIENIVQLPGSYMYMYRYLYYNLNAKLATMYKSCNRLWIKETFHDL